MNTANIATTKNQLSRLLERVKQGETILITDRQRPVARLQPLAPADAGLEGLVSSGVITAPEQALDFAEFLATPCAESRPGCELAAAVIEEREEGR